MPASEPTIVKLSQWDALILESLKTQGWPTEELLQRVQAGNLPVDDSKFQFDYARLTELSASDPIMFEHAVRHGYQIKYNTIRGIASWILLAFGQEAALHLEPGNESVTAYLNPDEYNCLTAALSYGWVVSGEHAASPETRSIYIIEALYSIRSKQ